MNVRENPEGSLMQNYGKVTSDIHRFGESTNYSKIGYPYRSERSRLWKWPIKN